MIATASDLALILSLAGLFAVAMSALAVERVREEKGRYEREQNRRVLRSLERRYGKTYER